jgi:hypothetical protein
VQRAIQLSFRETRKRRADYVSPALRKLQYPKDTGSRLTRPRKTLPSHVSGEEAIAIQEERKKAAEDAEALKQARKVQRERNAAEKKAALEQKKAEAAKKKEEAAATTARKPIGKKKTTQKGKKKTVEEVVERDVAEELTELQRVARTVQRRAMVMKQQVERDQRDIEKDEWLAVGDSTNEDEDVIISGRVCFKCDMAFTATDETYGCEECPRWFHVECLPRYIIEEAEEEGMKISDIPFECDYCQR